MGVSVSENNSVALKLLLLQGDECTFTWKVFTSWDYGIASPEAAHNKVAAVITGFRSISLVV